MITICAWYTLVLVSLVVLMTVFGNDKPLTRFMTAIAYTPVMIFVIMYLFIK